MATVFNILAPLAQTGTRPADGSATQPMTRAAGAVMFQNFLIALGFCALVVWIVRKAANPRTLALHNTPGRPNHLHLMHVGGLWLMMALLSNLAFTPAMALLGEPAEGTMRHIQVVLLCSTAGKLLFLPPALILAHVVFRHGITRGMGLTPRRWFVDSVRGVLALLAVYPVCVGLGLLAAYLVPAPMQKLHPMLQLLQGPAVSAGWKWLVVATACLVAPVVEEVLYRGFLQTALRRYFRGRWPAILIASALFAAVHVNPQTGDHLGDALPLFALAVALGYNYERTGRLHASILIHVLFNTVGVITVLWPR